MKTITEALTSYEKTTGSITRPEAITTVSIECNISETDAADILRGWSFNHGTFKKLIA